MATLSKAKISCDDDSHAFYVQFNPNEISIEENVGRYRRTPVKKPNKQGTEDGEDEPQLDPFAENAGLSLSTRLFFNTYTSDTSFTDVRAQFENLYYFFSPKSKDATTDTLHKIQFAWGTIAVTGILTSMRISYSMFAPDGTPVRAEVSIAIDGAYTGQSVTQAVRDATETYSDKPAGLMDKIAALTDPGNWRKLTAAGSNPRPPATKGGGK